MNAPVTVSVISSDELLAMPENGTDRWLIRGQLREKPTTVRDRWHSRSQARLAYLLSNWADQQPPPRGAVYSGAGCILRHNPDSTVGIDVVYLSADLAAQDPDDTTMIDGVPTLAVEILSPNDVEEEVNEKVDEYLAVGVRLVWLVDPHFETVQVYRPGQPPELCNVTQELSGDPHLPGLRIPVARIFAR